jgi:hypothetical protein
MAATPTIGALAATDRGTICGGKLDCYVLHDGTAIVTHGRVSTVDVKELIDFLLHWCRPITFLDRNRKLCIGTDSDDFVDRLCDVAARKLSVPAEQYDLAREMLRGFVMRGFQEMGDSLRKGLEIE